MECLRFGLEAPASADVRLAPEAVFSSSLLISVHGPSGGLEMMGSVFTASPALSLSNSLFSSKVFSQEFLLGVEAHITIFSMDKGSAVSLWRLLVKRARWQPWLLTKKLKMICGCIIHCDFFSPYRSQGMVFTK